MNNDVLDQVREAIATAATEGKPPPGRPTLIRLTGATDYQIRQALATLATEPPAPSALDPAVPNPQDHQELVAATAGDKVATASLRADAAGGEFASSYRHPRPWPLLLIGLGAAVAVWSGWVGLGELTGFGVVRLLPGLWDQLQINTAVVLSLSVEAYGGYALRCWLGSIGLSARTRKFARRSAITSLVVGAGAQIAYHLLIAANIHTAPWPVTVLVASVPVLVLGLASALAWMVTSDYHRSFTSKEV
ncbi:hypothetical protein [Actinokineospora iranica]|uniref:Uncharacterized protein n=1 Tax=Actinokineospora iranica TaxID=1271860 RepID=A0A1G6W1Q6_9PSEU|nr:hypothetical protein [Actinokineospora iranica]SDD58986.1 hypothetical protein SAMN05216174_113179 [Actinokineospora iranica]